MSTQISGKHENRPEFGPVLAPSRKIEAEEAKKIQRKKKMHDEQPRCGEIT